MVLQSAQHRLLLLLLLASVAISLAKNGGDNDDEQDYEKEDDEQDYEKEEDDQQELEEEASHRNLWIAHGAMAAIAWGILVPLAVGSSLIRNILEAIGLSKGSWFQIHRGLNSLAVLLTIVSFSIAVYIFNKEGEDEHFSEETHHTLGLIIFIFALLQALNGMLRPHLPHTAEEPVVDVKSDDDQVQEEVEEVEEVQDEEEEMKNIPNSTTTAILRRPNQPMMWFLLLRKRVSLALYGNMGTVFWVSAYWPCPGGRFSSVLNSFRMILMTK